MTESENIRADDVKACILALLEKQGQKPPNWHAGNVGLCWQNNGRLEWTEHGYLIGPQAIEQVGYFTNLKPREELRALESNQPLLTEVPPSTEGFLISRSEHHWRKRASHRVYAIADHHFLFLLDPSKSIPPPNQSSPGHVSWLSAASFYRSGLFEAKAKKARSSPRFFALRSQTTADDIDRRTRQIPRAHAIVDLSMVDDVRLMKSDQTKCFELHISGQVMRYEASSPQEMFEWVMRLRKLVRYGKACRSAGARMMAEASLWHRSAGQRSVLQYGLLYVKHRYHGTFQQRFCVLVHSKILMFNPFKRRAWTEQATRCTAYPHVQMLELSGGYVYSGEECLKDQEMDPNLPPRFFADTTSSDNNTDCVFMLWQSKQYHAVAKLREHLQVLKLGHRLGRKGSMWVFLARNNEEREAWVWALHRDMDHR
ncbi:hypothetical protein DFQ28_001662 [Apophysomyces sp. BC1034]|nr:hypothetical protein DFQ29_001505 [Apophysomyces sp. BC1021]KAG0190731.1 hypothetical protein DFQ28_001662 [Apophysomyces sp. BC1034]